MAQDSSNSTMEMGTSDQVLVATKSKKTAYIIGFVVMLAAIGGIVALVVVFAGNEGAGEPEVTVTTEGPTSPITPSPSPTTPSPSPTTEDPGTPSPPPTPSTEDPPVTDESTSESTSETTLEPITEEPSPGDLPIELEEIITGAFAPVSFNASFTPGNELLYRNENGDLVKYDIDTYTTTLLIYNSSELRAHSSSIQSDRREDSHPMEDAQVLRVWFVSATLVPLLQRSSRVIELSPEATHIVLAYDVVPQYRYSFGARYAVMDLIGNQTDIIPPNLPEGRLPLLQNFQWGPSETSLAYVFDNNIYYQSNLSSEPQQLTMSGQPDVIYNGVPDWVYEEEVFASNNALWFSKDGNKLAYASFNDTNVRTMRVPHYGAPGNVLYQYTVHHQIKYPKPGTTNPTVSVTLRDLTTDASNVYNAPTDIDQPILKAVTFVTNDSIAIMWTNRVQTTLRVVLCVQGQTTCTEIFQYTESDGWIDNIPLIFNDQGNSFITILPQRVTDSEIYKQIIQISDGNASSWSSAGRTNTPHTVSEILRWTSDDVIWYKANHVDDPGQQHIYSVDHNNNVVCFTCNIRRPDGGACLYNDATISASGERIAINCAGPDVPQVYIYDTAGNGSLVHVWDDSSETISQLAGRALPVTVDLRAPVAAGFPDADVHIQVPADYLNRTDIPLLVYVYAGPDTALVTKQWNIDWGSSLVTRYNIAVAHIDGRGSGLRGVHNMFAVNRALGSVEIEDQINVTRYLQNLPWVDRNRTCIWGWSYGGYAASLALARGGEVFRCAAAVAPVVDWRFYDTIYTERYMGLPTTADNLIAYQQSSLLSEDLVTAYRNKSYFLIHGTADDNVHYQHAMLLSRLLQRRDVYFTQMSYTDEDHGLVGVRPHLYHALEKFLEEHLWNSHL